MQGMVGRKGAVAASTTVTIFATYGGVIKTASLTVTPAPPLFRKSAVQGHAVIEDFPAFKLGTLPD
jgi:hypothetical protein